MLVEKCIEEISNRQGERQRQICIHRTNIGRERKNVFNEYLKKIGCEKVTS